MDTKKLRQKILDLAIRGKLVPQDPNDEPASLLLKRIRAEKERLIAEGKIKRSKKSKATSRESHYQNFVPPFEIPDSWEWVRLEELVEFQGGYAYKSNTYVDSSNWQVVRIGNVKNDKLLLDSQPVFVPEQIGNDTIKYQIQSDDILFTMTGTKGKRDYFYSVKVPSTSTKLLLNQRVGCLRRIAKDLYIDYLCNVLKSTYILDTIFATETGNVSQGNIGSESTLSLYIPLPPYLEQERIVRTLNEFILTLYNIDNYTGDLQETIQNAKSKILDLAMQGNLVSQDPTDEPASDMLLRINPKAKIITDNPQCQNLPSGWTLCELRDLCIFLSRGKSPKYSEMQNQYPVFAQKCNLKDGGISLALARFLDESTLNKWPSKYHLLDGDILINSTGTGTVGRTRIFDNSCMGHYTFVVPDSHVSVARIFEDINSKYIFYCLYSNECQRYFEENLAGSTNQKELYIDIIGDREIMLPPLKEQRRIVRTIEELYKVLNSIETSLQS